MLLHILFVRLTRGRCAAQSEFETVGAVPSARQAHTATEVMLSSVDKVMAVFGGDSGSSGANPP